MKKKVLLIHAPFEDLGFGKDWKKTDSLAAPLGLMYLADPLIKNGFDVSFLDLNVDQISESEFEKVVGDKNFVLLSTYSDSLKNVKKLIEKIKSANPHALILCGGPYCTLSGNYVAGSDATFVGEAEEVIADLLTKMMSGESLSDFAGLIYRKNGNIVKNPGITYVKDLNKTTHASHLLNVDKDYGSFLGLNIKGIVGIMSSRGCPSKCTYCTHKGVVPYRQRSAENVLAELKTLADQGVLYVVFYDDNFLMNKKRVIEIMDGIIRMKLKLKMVVQGRVDSADYSFYKKLKKAGVAVIMFGVESANQDVLDVWKKGTDIAQIKKAISVANKVGIITFGWFMIGANIEGEEHFRRNLEFLQKSRLDWVNVNILGYYQGSRLWSEAVADGLIHENETKVYANEKLSAYSYLEWLKMKDELLRMFFQKRSRKIRIAIKAIRLGIFPIFFRMITEKSFFEKIRSPFIKVEEESTISS